MNSESFVAFCNGHSRVRAEIIGLNSALEKEAELDACMNAYEHGNLIEPLLG